MTPNARRLAEVIDAEGCPVDHLVTVNAVDELAAWLDAQGVLAPAPVTLAAPVLPRPYDGDALDDAVPPGGWVGIPVAEVPTDQIVPTQEGLGLDAVVRIANGGPALDLDGCGPALWLVGLDDGRYGIHNGHTRWAVDAIRGVPAMRARIATPDGMPWRPR